MAGKVTNAGEVWLLERGWGKSAQADTRLRLFTNNRTLDGTETAADLTEFGAVQGYAAKNLVQANWSAATPGAGAGSALVNKAQMSYPQQTWTFDGTGGAVTVYGYYITDIAGTTVILAEKFPSSVTVTLNGDVIKVTPNSTGCTE